MNARRKHIQWRGMARCRVEEREQLMSFDKRRVWNIYRFIRIRCGCLWQRYYPSVQTIALLLPCHRLLLACWRRRGKRRVR